MELVALGIVALVVAMFLWDRVVERKAKSHMFKRAKAYELPSNTYTPPPKQDKVVHKHVTPFADAADRRFEAFLDENDEEDFTGEDWLDRYMASE